MHQLNAKEKEEPARSKIVELWMSYKDQRRRSRKQLPALLGADVIFISHAKSGRTWVRALISHAWHRLYGTPENELVDLDNFKTIDPRIPSIYFTHWVSEPSAVRRRISRLVRSRPVVFLARDPRDVATSHYFHFVLRSGPRTRRRRGLPADLALMSVPEFLLSPRFGVSAIAAYNQHWERTVAALPRGLALRYEALREAPLEHLRRLMAFLGTPASDEVLEAAIAFADFASLRQKERDGFFLSDELRPPATADENALKVRRGKIGGYRDYLTPEQIRQVDALVAGSV